MRIESKPVLTLRAGALTVDVVASGSLRTIRLAGELDASTDHQFRAACDDVWLTAPGRLVVSFAACTFCDGGSIDIVLALARRAGSRLRLVLPERRSARRVFDIVGIDEAFRFDASADAEPAFVLRRPSVRPTLRCRCGHATGDREPRAGRGAASCPCRAVDAE